MYVEPIARHTQDDPDVRMYLRGLSWGQFEAFLAMRGDASVPRVAFLDGDLELMSPGRSHERVKTTLARLIEAYAVHVGLELNGLGSWLIKNAPKLRGVEPDECYVLGVGEPPVPDLAIEVIWTSGGLDKLEIYRQLGVSEVWFWRDDRIEVFRLEGEDYSLSERSGVLPDLDLELVAELLHEPSQAEAVRKLLARS